MILFLFLYLVWRGVQTVAPWYSGPRLIHRQSRFNPPALREKLGSPRRWRDFNLQSVLQSNHIENLGTRRNV